MVNKVCLNCKAPFSCKPSHAPKKFYCSRACMAEHYKVRYEGKNNPNYRGGPYKHSCRVCSKTFESATKTSVYCSRRCLALRPDNLQRLASQSSAAGKKGGRRRQNHDCANCGMPVPIRWRKYCLECREDGLVRRGGRTDLNQKEIVAALRKAGAGVIVTSNMGGGFPELVVAYRGVVHLVEVKNPDQRYGRKGLNENQKKFNEEWKGAKVNVVFTCDEALQIIGAIK